ncbi:TPA: hypothetical protein CPT80_02720 [Candidatus Gastranaerophilales bacterium HUM_9]|nr:MAG TPA: hypothetical protein CPT80_02720 [Candidatus Gastranaerophilales bacterium HUM_9]HBX34776.1 hypothetical protein [Cyanobacteria bacterium UBA11440]
MGMSSSQARLLTLTSRLHSIEHKAQRIEAEKLRLANDSERVYEDYLNALDATKIQYSALTQNGTMTFIDATLNALENGAVPSYNGETSKNTFLLYDGANNKVLITQEFADEYGITGGNAQKLGSLDDYLTDHGCTKVEDMNTIINTNYSDIKSVTPVRNQLVSNTSTSTVIDPSSYTISGNLSKPVDSSSAATTSYNVTGTAPSVSSVAGVPTLNKKTVITSGVDASSKTMNVTSSSKTETTKFDYLIPANQSFNKITGKTYSFAEDELNMTMQQLSDKYGWNWKFDDTVDEKGKQLNELTTYGYSLNDVTLSHNYGLNHKQTISTDKFVYSANTTVTELLNHIASLSSDVTYDGNGTLTANNTELQFSSNDDARPGTFPSYQLETYLNHCTHSDITSSDKITLSSSTKIKDLLCTNSGGTYGDFRIYDPNGKTIDCTFSYYPTHEHKSSSTPDDNMTYAQYLDYLKEDPELKAAGFTWWEDSEGVHTSIGNGYKIAQLTYLDDVNGELTDEKTTTNTTSVELNRNAIAENIYLARSIVNGTKAYDYNANHTTSINAILTEMQNAYNGYATNENKRQLTLFSEELSTALVSGNKTQIQNALAKLGQTITSDKYAQNGAETRTETGNNNNKTITINKTVNNVTYTFNDSNVSITPNTTEVNDGQTENPGTLTVGSNSDMEKYLAYKLYQYNNGQSYENYLASIQGQSYNAYQLAELVENFDSYKTQLVAGNNLKSSLTKYDSTHYNLNQTNSNSYNVTNTSTAASYNVTVANTDDILDRLAYDIYTKQGSTGNPNTIKTQLRTALNDQQLASLSSFYGTGSWNTIVNNLSNNMTAASVSAFTTKYDGYNITYKTSNDVTINESPNSHQETTKGRVNVPTIKGIASNLAVAFRKAGKTIDETELRQKLEAKYGTDNDTNNLTLANINEVVCDYLTNGNNAGIDNIYNNIYNGSALTIASTYTADKFVAKRTDLGVANVTYGTTETQVPAGTWHWKNDENYQTWYAKYQKLKTLEEYQFEIVKPELCNKYEFVSNYITQAGASLLTFSINEDGSFNMVGTNVSVETSLQEISNDINLKKAEAKYEADMKAIDKKDSRYDTQLAACETERNAIKEEVDTLKTVAKENVERTFKLFS